ncbi:MAG: hypothetical protein ABSG84_03620 [Acidobacteriaceae bacterium]|jgi:uncharacterized membrane protein
MRLLRRRINTFFALQAILLFMAGLRVLVDTRFAQRGISPLRHWIFLTGYLLLSLVFIKAWRVTLKPSPFRQAWGIAAAIISILAGLYLLWVAHSTHTFAVPALTVLLIGLATVFLLFQGRTASDRPVVSPTVPASTPDEPGPQPLAEGHLTSPASTSVAS